LFELVDVAFGVDEVGGWLAAVHPGQGGGGSAPAGHDADARVPDALHKRRFSRRRALCHLGPDICLVWAEVALGAAAAGVPRGPTCQPSEVTMEIPKDRILDKRDAKRIARAA
jgi:hypothetical protein